VALTLNFSQLVGEGLGGTIATERPTISAQLRGEEGRRSWAYGEWLRWQGAEANQINALGEQADDSEGI
jgi:hypothetical protein